MLRHALSLALALPLTVLIGCDQAVAPASPELAGGDDPAPVLPSPEPGGGGAEEPAEPNDLPEMPPELVPEVAPIDAVLALEGAEVIPQTLLHLDSTSANCDGEAVAYQWSVTQPAGSVALLKPHSQSPTPTFEANVAGDYVFALESFGQDGELCTPPRTFLLAVTPESALHIELLWHTPGDPDEADEGPEAGADLDLHVLHPYATGPFDPYFDCFWFNAMPNWGSLDPTIDDDPALDRDDTDGAGPENFNLNLAGDDHAYRVQVHSWSDHDYGDSEATVRVYLFGDLVYETEPVTLTERDLWHVGTLEMPSGVFSPAATSEGAPDITPDFNDPFFTTP